MPIDILLGDDFDLDVAGGDFVSGESTRQHQQILLLNEKGELREFPTVGVGLASWLNDDNQVNDLNSRIKTEYENDGMKVLSVSGRDAKLQVEAEYE